MRRAEQGRTMAPIEVKQDPRKGFGMYGSVGASWTLNLGSRGDVWPSRLTVQCVCLQYHISSSSHTGPKY